ncbi:hypothetical protein I302_108142 [Kwoniella bestiolae CBS 10118]|uniref:Sfi1 spindle body domain-containing protein n=1 Tax=Kwoniella bestiolae CBS 10118 TaxID=1296100 RepID=A0A1B9FWJ6_9TREE|nr:hypothetical protein I302_07492 [Kwoniella bestiolae CBS 10118]OCF23139.1 hypothetical protein I302_07492 [Kwoniella bestiolae CBS 10118]
MQTSSSSSSRSNTTLTHSTSLWADVDLVIVEKIIEKARHATSFPQIFRPYAEVLREYGLSDTDDSLYYGFLLKLGVIKAPTWADKWEIWKATRSSRMIPWTSTPEEHYQEELYEEEGEGEEDYEEDDQSFSQSQLPGLRARVPFLASASSDLDEGFAPSNHEEGTSYMNSHRPSPRKELSRNSRTRTHGHGHSRNGSRSLVGYTPEQSFQDDGDTDDLLHFDPPMRTSTPIVRSPKYQNPSAYSVSDVSQALEQTTEEISALGLGLMTPKGKSTFSPMIQQEEEKTWVDRIDEITEGERRFMERKADDFYRLGLMGRCWDMWFKTSEFYRVTYKNIPIARDNLLLRQVIEKWSKATQYQLSLPGTADQHRRLHLKLSVMRKWAERVKEKRLGDLKTAWTEEKRLKEIGELFQVWKVGSERRRTERWKLDMAERERRFTDERDRRCLQDSFKFWRVESRGKQAEYDKKRRLVFGILEEWRYQGSKKRELQVILSGFEQKRLQDAFAKWKRKSILQPKEDQIRQIHETGLIQRVWDDWRISSWQAKQSSTFDRRRLLLMVLDKWRIARIRQQRMERKALIYDKTRLLDKAFRGWRLESCGRLLVQAKDKRLQEKVWFRWKDKLNKLDRLNSVADQFAEHRKSAQLQRLFSRWRSAASAHQTNHLRATLIHEQKLQINVITKWRTSTAIIKTNQGLADRAHAFFLLRTAFKAWRVEDARRKGERWIEAKNQDKVREVFTKWKGLTVKYKDLRRRETVMRDHSDRQTLQRCLERWTNRVIEVKDRELRIARARDDHVKSQLLQKWRNHLSIIRSNQKKADDTLEIRELENLRRVFRSWRGKAKRQKRLRLTAEASLIERDQKLVRGVFERWYEKKRERDLVEMEKEVAFLHENVILYGVMDKWKAGTEILPGITADSLRLKRKAFNTWLNALGRKKRADEMQNERDRKFLSEAFGLWRDATAHKTALNARRTRGRSRPSALSDRRSSLGVSTGSRRVTPTSTTFPHTSRIHSNGHEGRLSPNLGTSIRERDTETVRSEPVYSRLRSELGLGATRRRRSRGESEEPEVIQSDWNENGNGLYRPRSGSEMIRALRGDIPGR